MSSKILILGYQLAFDDNSESILSNYCDYTYGESGLPSYDNPQIIMFERGYKSTSTTFMYLAYQYTILNDFNDVDQISNLIIYDLTIPEKLKDILIASGIEISSDYGIHYNKKHGTSSICIFVPKD